MILAFSPTEEGKKTHIGDESVCILHRHVKNVFNASRLLLWVRRAEALSAAFTVCYRNPINSPPPCVLYFFFSVRGLIGFPPCWSRHPEMKMDHWSESGGSKRDKSMLDSSRSAAVQLEPAAECQSGPWEMTLCREEAPVFAFPIRRIDSNHDSRKQLDRYWGGISGQRDAETSEWSPKKSAFSIESRKADYRDAAISILLGNVYRIRP